MRRLVRTTAVSAAVAALVLPGLALGQQPAPKLVEVAELRVPGPRVSPAAPGAAVAHDLGRERERERRARHGPRGRASRRRRDRCRPADRRVEQHEGRAARRCDGGRPSVPEGAKAGHARVASSSSAPTTRRSRTFTTDGEELTKSVAQTPETSEGTHIYDALIEATERALTSRGSAGDHRPALRRHGRG